MKVGQCRAFFVAALTGAGHLPMAGGDEKETVIRTETLNTSTSPLSAKFGDWG